MSEKPKRRWFQFSLRALLVLTLLVCCGLGWLGHSLRLARERVQAIAECDQAGIYVYQYEPTPLGRALRRWTALDRFVRARFGDSLLSSPSAVSAFSLRGDRVEFLVSRLKLFPALKTLILGNIDDETRQRIEEELPHVDVLPIVR